MTSGELFREIYKALEEANTTIEIGYVTGPIRDLGPHGLHAITSAIVDHFMIKKLLK